MSQQQHKYHYRNMHDLLNVSQKLMKQQYKILKI